MKKIIYTLLMSISFISCMSLKNKYEDDIIEIIYIPGLVDFSVPYTEEELEKINKERAGDTIIVDANVFSGVISYINSHDNKAHRDSVSDPRFFIKHKENKCVIDNITDNEFDRYTEYNIKCISEYYNYFEEEDMQYDRDVIRYGIPKNYKCLLSDSILPPSEVKKVLKCGLPKKKQ